MLSIGAASNTIIANPASGAETVLIATPLVSIPKDAVQVLLLFEIVLTTGTGTNSLIWKILRGAAVGGTQLAIGNGVPAGASAIATVIALAVDILIFGAQAQWCLSLFMNASTGAGVTNQATAAAIFLS